MARKCTITSKDEVVKKQLEKKYDTKNLPLPKKMIKKELTEKQKQFIEHFKTKPIGNWENSPRRPKTQEELYGKDLGKMRIQDTRHKWNPETGESSKTPFKKKLIK